MRVLGEALYSTPFVAIRELVQNAHDSCTRRLLEDAAFEPRIDVRFEGGYLIFTDNGAGLTEAEIHTYLATVGTGYTRTMRDQSDAQDLIGYFGLGFLSAFAVSEKVEFWTTSFKSPTLAYRFTSRSGESYAVQAAPSRPIGSELRLRLRRSLPEFSTESIRGWLHRYCCLLRHPVFFHEEAVNAETPPWRAQSELAPLRFKRLALDFAKNYDPYSEPLAIMPMQGEAISGLLWIHGGLSYDSSDNRTLAVYVRGMLITHNNSDLLPRWAGFVSGVLESNVLRPTASRESLREDEVFAATQRSISLALYQGLADLARNDPESWQRVLLRHNEGLLGAAVVDAELFELLADSLLVPTTEGELSMAALLTRCEQTIYVSNDDRFGAESVLLRALKKPVVLGRRFAAARFCEQFAQRRNTRLLVLGTQEGDAHLFGAASVSEEKVAALKHWFAADDTEVLPREFAPSNLPFAVVVNREVELKRRLEADDANKRAGQAILGLVRHYSTGVQALCGLRLYVNTTNPVVQRLFELAPEQREKVLRLLQALVVWNSSAHPSHLIECALEHLNQSILAISEFGAQP